MDSSDPAALKEALERLWIQFLPQMQERVSKLASAAEALAAGSLSEKQRTEAHDAAHKLAGVLGTFGLTKGTILAREAEIAYSGDVDPQASHVAHLDAIARQLADLIAAHR